MLFFNLCSVSSVVLISLSNQHVLGRPVTCWFSLSKHNRTSWGIYSRRIGNPQERRQTFGPLLSTGLKWRNIFHTLLPLQLYRPQFMTLWRRIQTRKTKEQAKPCKSNVSYFLSFLGFMLIFALILLIPFLFLGNIWWGRNKWRIEILERRETVNEKWKEKTKVGGQASAGLGGVGGCE